MVPTAFVEIEKMPLTPSGKIDRRSLPVPSQKDFCTDESFTPPRNEFEKQLASIWSEVLGVERIGVHDDFFSIGGHSLLAVKLFARMNEHFEQKLPLSLLFKNGTIAKLAESLEQSNNNLAIAKIVPLTDNQKLPTLILMPGLNGQLMYAKDLVNKLGHKFAFFGLQPNLNYEHLDVFSDFRVTATKYL